MLYELKSIRKSRGYKQDQAADALGIRRGTYRNWEQCIYMPRDNATIKRIADFFGVSMEALFGYDMVNPGDLAKGSHPHAPSLAVPVMEGVMNAASPAGEVVSHAPVPTEVMRGREGSFLMRVDAGMDRVIPTGSLVLIDPDGGAGGQVGGACAVCLDGGPAVIRRVKMLANGVEVSPDSTDPTIRGRIIDMDIPSTGEAEIVGRAVWYMPPYDVAI